MRAKRSFALRIAWGNAFSPFLTTSGQFPVLDLLIYLRTVTISLVSDGNGGLVAALSLSSSKVNSTFPIHCTRLLRAANGELG